jgi:hypothetical protein
VVSQNVPSQASGLSTQSGRNIGREEWIWVGTASALILILTIAPIVWGYLTTPPELTYSGLVYYWEDGNTYLAKIWQGFRGDWVFTNPYSIDPGPPIYSLYINYLLLGHIAKWLGLETILIFHVARLVSGAVLLISIYVFVSRFFSTVLDRRLAFLVGSVGSGFGWLALLFGYVAPDLWQTEYSPFRAILANLHYPLAIAAFIWLIDLLCVGGGSTPNSSVFQWILLIAGTLILAITHPYGLVVVALVGASWIVISWLTRRRIERRSAVRLIAVIMLAAPFAMYDIWIVLTNEYVATLYAQDIVRMYPLWDLLLAGGLLLLFGAIGFVAAVRHNIRDAQRVQNELIPVLWLIAAGLLMYSPSLQQARFGFALYIPLGILAVEGLRQIKRPTMRLASLAMLAVTSLTNIIFLLVVFIGLSGHPSNLFFTRGEWKGMMYLRSSVDQHSFVLASPEMGLYIPAWAGQRVVCGHTVETLHGPARFQEVRSFFTGQLNEPEMFLAPVDLILMGPRERSLGSPQIPPAYVQVFSDGDKVIYKRK